MYLGSHVGGNEYITDEINLCIVKVRKVYDILDHLWSRFDVSPVRKRWIYTPSVRWVLLDSFEI